jgi:hypothetical protein
MDQGFREQFMDSLLDAPVYLVHQAQSNELKTPKQASVPALASFLF